METMTLYINGVLDRMLITPDLGDIILDDILVGIKEELVTIKSLEYKSFRDREYLFIVFTDNNSGHEHNYSFNCNFTEEQIEAISNIEG